MYLFIKAFKFKILFLIVLFSISAGISSHLLFKNGKKYIKQNWSEYKNELYIQPISGFIKPNKGENSVETSIKNMQKTQYTITQSIFKVFTEPINLMMKAIMKVINNMKNSLNNIRSMFFKVRAYILKYIVDLMNRLSDLFASMIYTFAKTRDIFAKIKGIYTIFIYFLWTIFNFLEWMVHTLYKLVRDVVVVAIALLGGILWLIFWPFAPIIASFAVLLGIAGEGFTICFDKNTLIKMENGSYKKINEIEIGDILRDGGKVTSILKSEIKNRLMYNYNGIIVSGDHLVFDNDKWKRVKECNVSIKITNYDEKYIYCLTTTTNIIPTITSVFRDYRECNKPFIQNYINQLILSYLNNENNLIKKNIIKNIEENGFYQNTEIKLSKGIIQYIKDIKIGDYLENGKKIIGIVKIDNNLNLYRYFLQNNSSIIVSSNQLVFENNKWINIFNSKNAIKIKKDNSIFGKYLYNLITEDNQITIGDTFFRDYLEVGDINLNNNIDDFIENYLNIMIKRNDCI